MNRLIIGVLSVIFTMYISQCTADGKYRTLLLSGSNNHDWRATTPVIMETLEKDGRFKVDVTERPDTMTVAMLNRYDLIVSNWNKFPAQNALWPPAVKQAFLDFIEKGGGFVCIHAASATHGDWDDFFRIAGGCWGEKTHHGAMDTFTVNVRKHPITKGMKDFDVFDELWVDLKYSPDAEIICTAKADEYRSQPDKTEPVALVTHYGDGRGFYLVLGHNANVMQNPDWQQLLLQGSAWVAAKRVGSKHKNY